MIQRLSPGSLKELEQVVAWAVAEEQPLEIQGNASKRAFGRPVEATHILDTLGLSGIDMYEPDELVMSAGAGTPLVDIENALAERGQMLAFEPADYGRILAGEAGQQTIGGVFACNLAGPRRVKAGAARDHLLGLQMVSGHGQTIKTGGRVVKNVTGYDLCKLLTGSMGTLAVMSHLTFKVLPAPEDTITLLLQAQDIDCLLRALRLAMGSAHEVSGSALVSAGCAGRSVILTDGPVACLRLEGTTPSIAYRIDRLESQLGNSKVTTSRLDRDQSLALWREIRDVTLLAGEQPFLWRLSIPPTDTRTLLNGLVGLNGPVGDFIADWSGGLVWFEDGRSEDIRALLPSSGHATLVRAPEAVRCDVDVFQPQSSPLFALSRRVKNSFDPKCVLNPGRVYAGL